MFFDSQVIAEQFAGEPVIDSKPLCLESLCWILDQLREATVRDEKIRKDLAKFGFDPEKLEDETLARKSAALRGSAYDPGAAEALAATNRSQRLPRANCE